jgi:hypothetical protein
MQTSDAMRREKADAHSVVMADTCSETSLTLRGGRRSVLWQQPAGYEATSNLKPPASTRQRNSGDSGGGDSSGVQPVNFSSA